MPFANLKFEIFPIKNIYGKRTGRVYCEIGGVMVEGKDRAEIEQKILACLERTTEQRKSAILVSGNEVTLIEEQTTLFGVSVETSRGEIGNSPLIKKRHTSTSWRAFDECLDRAMSQIAHDQWQGGDDNGPEWLPESLRAEFRDWAAWQRRYREARDAGKTDNEAHAIACGMEHLLK